VPGTTTQPTPMPRPPRGLAGDGGWLALWPLSMAVGVWGTAMLYRGLMDGAPTLLPGLVLCGGGLWLTGRWVAQARKLQRAWRRRTEGTALAAPAPPPSGAGR
jgi:hypothetical protein